MDAEATPIKTTYTETTSYDGPTSGNAPMMWTLFITVAAIGYFTNIISLDSSYGGVSHMMRALGAVCPPLGAVLGYM